eukprot:scaffold998_cov146-Isochrysis_galbana.AAC.2
MAVSDTRSGGARSCGVTLQKRATPTDAQGGGFVGGVARRRGWRFVDTRPGRGRACVTMAVSDTRAPQDCEDQTRISHILSAPADNNASAMP